MNILAFFAFEKIWKVLNPPNNRSLHQTHSEHITSGIWCTTRPNHQIQQNHQRNLSHPLSFYRRGNQNKWGAFQRKIPENSNQNICQLHDKTPAALANLRRAWRPVPSTDAHQRLRQPILFLSGSLLYFIRKGFFGQKNVLFIYLFFLY